MKKECDFCGAENEDWMKICINCGNELKDKPIVKEAKVEKPTTIRTNNPNNTLILILIILSVVLVILLFAVISKFG